MSRRARNADSDHARAILATAHAKRCTDLAERAGRALAANRPHRKPHASGQPRRPSPMTAADAIALYRAEKARRGTW